MTGHSVTESESKALTVISQPMALTFPTRPNLIAIAGPAAEFAWDEFFKAQIPNRHTRAAYLHAVRQFLKWVSPRVAAIDKITPGLVGEYFDQHPGSVPTKKLHLSALRAFFDVLVNRHVVIFNSAATVRGERYQVHEGKTPEITGDQARALLASFDAIKTIRPIDKRDKSIIATLIYTATRAGAIASLKLKDFTSDGTQYSLRFREKGGKSRSIPVRHDLQRLLLQYLEAIAWESEPGDTPFFRSAVGRSGGMTALPVRNVDICRMVKRRLRNARLPVTFSPHSFRVATLTDLLTQGVSLEDAQYLAGHADPRTTRLYDRRQRQVTRNTVERISI